jgi:hypothetical protein
LDRPLISSSESFQPCQTRNDICPQIDLPRIAGLADPFIGGVIISVILICGIIVSFYTVEKVGRRTSVLWAGAAMAVLDIAIGKHKINHMVRISN